MLGFRSKHRLTPHLTSYTPPYTFIPFLNPPTNSTLPKPQYTKHKCQIQSKTQSTSHVPRRNPKHKAKSEAPPLPHTSHPILPPTLSHHFSTRPTVQPFKTPTHKAPPNTAQNKIRSTALSPDLTSCTPPTLSPHFSTRLTFQPFKTPIHKAPLKSHAETPNTIQNHLPTPYPNATYPF